MPISALTIAESAPVVHLVFSHTRLRPPDLDATAATLVFFTLGLFGWGAQYILARGFYATRNTLDSGHCRHGAHLRQLACLLAAGAPLPAFGIGHGQLIGIMVYTVILFFLLARRTHNREEGALARVFPQGLRGFRRWSASACYKLRLVLEPHLAWHRFAGALSLLVMVTAAGILLLLLMGKLLRIRELDQQFERLWLLARWTAPKPPPELGR